MANILIVDDDTLLSEHLSIHIEENGNKVYTAPNADQAWRQIRGHRVDIVLLDINMPGMNGLQFLEALRRDKQYSSIPVIMISTNSKIETFQKARSIGIVDYIVKPAQPDLVSTKLKQALQRLALLTLKENQKKSEHLLVTINEQMVVFTFPSEITELSLDYLSKKLNPAFREQLRGKICLFDFQYQEHFTPEQLNLVNEMQRLTKPNKNIFIAGRNYAMLLALAVDPEYQLFISMDDFIRKVKPALASK